jgi:hypothetical protein
VDPFEEGPSHWVGASGDFAILDLVGKKEGGRLGKTGFDGRGKRFGVDLSAKMQ